MGSFSWSQIPELLRFARVAELERSETMPDNIRQKNNHPETDFKVSQHLLSNVNFLLSFGNESFGYVTQGSQHVLLRNQSSHTLVSFDQAEYDACPV